MDLAQKKKKNMKSNNLKGPDQEWESFGFPFTLLRKHFLLFFVFVFPEE